MSTISGLIDLNADAIFGDRQNEVSGFDSSEINACAVVPASVDNEVEIRGHEFCPVGNSLGENRSVKPGHDEIPCGKGFDNDSDKCLDPELNYGFVNEEYGYRSGVTENGSTGVEFKVNQEALAEDNMIVCCNVDQNVKADFGYEGNESGQKCYVDELADQGVSTVLVDEDIVKADDDKVFADRLKDHCALRTEESMGQSLDCIPHVEAKDVEDFRESLRKFPISRNNLCQEEPSCLLKHPSLEICAPPEEIISQTMDINLTDASPLGNIQHECHGLNLVVDFNPCSKLVEVDMNMKSVSSEFHVSDLVWGKVRGHPWWPGQIVDPSAASKKAKKYSKKESYLIAYFGDLTFAWNDASKMKPFQMYFSQLEKQSNSDNFYYAVDCALDEVSRRVEFGLSCPCTPEVFTNLKTQTITNAGIQKCAGKRDGGDRFLNAITFETKKLVNFVKLLAGSPLVEFGRLDFAIARAQLLAFRHSKGYSQPSEFEANDVLFKNDMQIIPMDMEEKEHYDYRIDSQGLETDTGYSHKRKHVSRKDCVWPHKKQKRLSDLMSEKCLRLPNDRQKAYENTSDDNSHESQNIKPIQLHNVSVDEMWWQLRLAATDPTRGDYLTVMVNFFTGFRNFSSPHNSTPMELCKDSYWTDRIIQSIPEEQSLLDKQNDREEFLHVNLTEGDAPCFKLQAAADGKECFGKSSKEDTCPAALILEFTNLDSIPSETRLNKIFGHFGPLMESQTELLKKSRCARVVFKRFSDAENAFSSAGKYSIFGPSLLRYHLKVMPPSSKVPIGAGKRGRKRSSGKGGEL